MSSRRKLEQLLIDCGWQKSNWESGYPQWSWFKRPIASTKCQETSLIDAIKRQLQIEDDFYDYLP